MYYLYILKCSDNTFYTGIAKNLQKRINEHNIGNNGAKYTKARRPIKLIYSCRFKNRSNAQKEEARVKSLPKKDKLELIKIYASTKTQIRRAK